MQETVRANYWKWADKTDNNTCPQANRKHFSISLFEQANQRINTIKARKFCQLQVSFQIVVNKSQFFVPISCDKNAQSAGKDFYCVLFEFVAAFGLRGRGL